MATPKGSGSKTTVSVALQFQADNASLSKAAKQVGNNLTQLQKRTALAANKMSSFIPAFAAIGGAAFAAFNVAIRGAVGFEDSFAGVKKTLDFSGQAAKQTERNFKVLAKSIVDISTQAPVAANDLNKIAEIGGQLGIEAVNITKFTETIAKLTVSTNMAAEDGAFALSRLAAITRTPERQIENLASVVVRLGNEFAATESEIVNSAQKIAAAMELLESPTSNAAADSLALAAALKQVGQQTQAGSTAVARALDKMSTAVIQGGRELSIFAQVAEMTSDEFVRLAELSPADAFVAFLEGLGAVGAGGGDTVSLLKELGLAQQRTLRALRSMALASGDVKSALDSANEEFVLNNALQTEAEKRYETVTSQVGLLRNQIQALAIDIGNDALPAVNGFLKSLQTIAVGTDSSAFAVLAKNFIAIALAANSVRTAVSTASETLDDFQKRGVAGTGIDGRVQTGMFGLGGNVGKSFQQRKAETSGFVRDNFGIGGRAGGEGAFLAEAARSGVRIEGLKNILDEGRVRLGEGVFDDTGANKKVLAKAREADGSLNIKLLETDAERERFTILSAITQELEEQLTVEQRIVLSQEKQNELIRKEKLLQEKETEHADKVLRRNQAKSVTLEDMEGVADNVFADDRDLRTFNIQQSQSGRAAISGGFTDSQALNVADFIQNLKDPGSRFEGTDVQEAVDFVDDNVDIEVYQKIESLSDKIKNNFDGVARASREAAVSLDKMDEKFSKAIQDYEKVDENITPGEFQGQQGLGQLTQSFIDDDSSALNLMKSVEADQAKNKSLESIAKKHNMTTQELEKQIRLGKKQQSLVVQYNSLLESTDEQGREIKDGIDSQKRALSSAIDEAREYVAMFQNLDAETEEYVNDFIMDTKKLDAMFEALIETVSKFSVVASDGTGKLNTEINELAVDINKLKGDISEITGVKDADNRAQKLNNNLYNESTKQLLKNNKERQKELILKKKSGKLNKEEIDELKQLKLQRQDLLGERKFEKQGKTNVATQALKELLRGFMLGDGIARFINAATAKIISFMPKFQAFFKIILNFFSKVGAMFQRLGTFLQDKLFNAFVKIEDILQGIAKIALRVGNAFIKLGKGMFAMFKNVFDFLAFEITKVALPKLIKHFKKFSAQIKQFFAPAVTAVVKLFNTLSGHIQRIFNNISARIRMSFEINKEIFKEFVEETKAAFNQLANPIRNVLKRISERIRMSMQINKELFLELVAETKLAFNQLTTAISSIFKRLAARIRLSMQINKEIFMEFVQETRAIFSGLFDLFKKLGVAFKNSLPGFLIQSIVSRFALGFKAIGEGIVQLTVHIAKLIANSKALAFITRKFKELAAGAKKLGQVMAESIGNKLMLIATQLRSFGDGVINFMLQKLNDLMIGFGNFGKSAAKSGMETVKNSQTLKKAGASMQIVSQRAGHMGKNIVASAKRFAMLHKGMQAVLNVAGGLVGVLARKRITLLRLSDALMKSTMFTKGFKLAAAGLTAVINGVKAAVMGLMTMFMSMVVMTAIFSFFFKLQEESKKTAAAIKEIANEINQLNEVTKDLDFQEIRLEALNKALESEMGKKNPNSDIIKVIEDEIDNITNAYAAKTQEVRDAEAELGRTLLFDTTAQGQNVEKRFDNLFKSMGFDAIQAKNFQKIIEEELGASLNNFEIDNIDDFASTLFQNLDDSFGGATNQFDQSFLTMIQELAKSQGLTMESYIDQFDTLVDFGAIDSMIGSIITDSGGGFIKKLEAGNFDFGGLNAKEMMDATGLNSFTNTFLDATNIQFEDMGNGMVRIYQEKVDQAFIGMGGKAQTSIKTQELGMLPVSVLGNNPKQQIENLTTFAENVVFMDTIFSQMRGKGGNPIFADNVQVGNQSKVSTFMQMQNEALIERFEFLRMNNVIAQDLNAHTMNREKLVKTVMMAETQLHEQQLQEAEQQLKQLGLAEFEMSKFEKALNDTLAKSASNAVSIFTDLPKRMRKSVRAMLDELTIKSFQLAKFDKDVRRLAAIAPMLAKDIASQGLAAQNILKQFLQDPAAIATAEGLLQRMRPKDAADMGLTVEQQREAQQQGLALGTAASEGILVGIQERKAQIGQALVSGIEDAIEESKAFLDVVNPSMLVAREIGKPMAEGAAVGIDNNHGFLEKSMIDMAQAGIDAASDKMSEMEEFIADRGYFDGSEYYKQFAEGIKANGDTVVQAVAEEIQEVSEFLTYGFSQATQDIGEALNMMFAVTGGLRDITAANYAVQKAEQALMATRRQNATLSERIQKNQIALQKAELEGRKNNITMAEEAGLLQKKIALDEMKRKQKGQFSASERKRIVEAEEELERVRLAAEAGIATSLDVEVAEEKLAELKGTNKSLDEQRLAILEVSLAEEELNDAKEKAREVDPELISLREEQIALLDEQANASFELQTAYDGLEAATENVYQTELKYEEARQAFKDFAESSPETFKALVDAYGGVGGSIDTVITKTINLANNTETSMAKAIQSVREYITELERAQQVESLSNALGSTTRDDYNFDSKLRSEINQNKSVSALFGDTGIEDTGLSAIQGDLMNPGIFGIGGDRTTAANRDIFADSEDFIRSEESLQRIRKGRGDRRDLANAFQFLYGVQSSIDKTGQIVLNSGQLQAALKDKNNPLSKLGLDYKTLVEQIKMADGITVVDMDPNAMSGGYDMARRQEGERDPYDYGSAKVPYAKMFDPQNIDHIARLINMSGGTATDYDSAAEALLGSGKTYKDFQNHVSKGQKDMLRRLIAEKLDLAHEAGKADKYSVILKRKYGGTVRPFQRALVGEYGPEFVTAMPGGGLRVTPQGSERGGSITVDNLNVNVTGVPTDPIQARKAAVQIQGALRRLEKEGNAGSGLSRR